MSARVGTFCVDLVPHKKYVMDTMYPGAFAVDTNMRTRKQNHPLHCYYLKRIIGA